MELKRVEQLIEDFYLEVDDEKVTEGLDIAGMARWTVSNGEHKLNELLSKQYGRTIDFSALPPAENKAGKRKNSAEKGSEMLNTPTMVDRAAGSSDQELREDLRERLEAYFEEVNPEVSADAIKDLVNVGMQSGEEELNAQLKEEFGIGYLSGEESDFDSEEEEESLPEEYSFDELKMKRDLRIYYKKHDSAYLKTGEHIDQVIELMRQIGKEAVFEKLESFYKESVEKVLEEHDRNMRPKVAETPSAPKDKRKMSLVSFLSKAETVSDFDDIDELRENLKSYYEQHDPEELDNIDDVIELGMDIGLKSLSDNMKTFYGQSLIEFLKERRAPKQSQKQKVSKLRIFHESKKHMGKSMKEPERTKSFQSPQVEKPMVEEVEVEELPSKPPRKLNPYGNKKEQKSPPVSIAISVFKGNGEKLEEAGNSQQKSYQPGKVMIKSPTKNRVRVTEAPPGIELPTQNKPPPPKPARAIPPPVPSLKAPLPPDLSGNESPELGEDASGNDRSGSLPNLADKPVLPPRASKSRIESKQQASDLSRASKQRKLPEVPTSPVGKLETGSSRSLPPPVMPPRKNVMKSSSGRGEPVVTSPKPPPRKKNLPSPRVSERQEIPSTPETNGKRRNEPGKPRGSMVEISPDVARRKQNQDKKDSGKGTVTVEELVDFYNKYDKPKLEIIPKIMDLAKKMGRKALNEKLFSFYQTDLDRFARSRAKRETAETQLSEIEFPQPAARVSYNDIDQLEEDLIVFYEKHDPVKLGSLEQIVALGKRIGRKKLDAKLTELYGYSLDKLTNRQKPKKRKPAKHDTPLDNPETVGSATPAFPGGPLDNPPPIPSPTISLPVGAPQVPPRRTVPRNGQNTTSDDDPPPPIPSPEEQSQEMGKIQLLMMTRRLQFRHQKNMNEKLLK